MDTEKEGQVFFLKKKKKKKKKKEMHTFSKFLH
jgi:hypothetical protein